MESSSQTLTAPPVAARLWRLAEAPGAQARAIFRPVTQMRRRQLERTRAPPPERRPAGRLRAAAARDRVGLGRGHHGACAAHRVARRRAARVRPQPADGRRELLRRRTAGARRTASGVSGARRSERVGRCAPDIPSGRARRSRAPTTMLARDPLQSGEELSGAASRCRCSRRPRDGSSGC